MARSKRRRPSPQRIAAAADPNSPAGTRD
jgi:hypothetical protein